MHRRFTEDGWQFDITVRDMLDPREVRVRFYDDSLVDPSTSDVYKVEVRPPKTYEKKEVERFSLGPWSWTTTKEVPVPYEDIAKQVEDAIEQAWDRIEEIDEHPSEQLDRGIQEARGGE